MAACQQLPVRGAKIKSKATDSKARNETQIGFDMRTTEDDWDRLGQLIYADLDNFMLTIAYTPEFDQHVVGKEDDRWSSWKFWKYPKQVEKVIFAFGYKETLSSRDFVRDFGLIKCLAAMNETPNPFFFIPALDGFEMMPSDFSRRGSGNSKSRGNRERKACNTSMVQKELCVSITYKNTVKRLRAAERVLKASEEVYSRKKSYATEKFKSKEKPKTKNKSDAKLESRASDVSDSCNKVKTTVETESRKRDKATEDSDAKIESKDTEGSEPRKKAKVAEQSDTRKRAKAIEKSRTEHELKASERETRYMKDVIMNESEVGKGADDQEKASSGKGSKSVRTCMNCSLQEPAPKVFKKCGRCKDEGCPDPPYYCGRDCQVLDWTARHRQQHEKNAGALSSS